MMLYNVFTRTWWRQNAAWPNGLEPHMGPKRVIGRRLTLAEARRVAYEYNRTHEPGRYSRKAEIEEV